MNQKRQYKTYTKAFKEEALALVIDQGYTVPNAAQLEQCTIDVSYAA